MGIVLLNWMQLSVKDQDGGVQLHSLPHMF